MPYGNALAYIQIFLTLLLFVLGIPAFIIEPSVDYRIRHILHKRLPYRIVMGLLVVTMLVVLALLFFAKAEQGVQQRDSTNIAVTIDLATKSVTAFLVISFAFVSWKMMRHDVQASLVRRICRRLTRRFKRKGYYADEDLRDLLAIGVHGSPGYEKGVVIDAVASVGAMMQRSPKYTGTEFASFIHGLLEIVRAPETSGDEPNVIACIETLHETWARLEQLRLQFESDAIATVEVTCLLGEFAISIASDAAALQALGVVEDNREVPFRVGRLAVTAGRFRVAAMCLNRLEALAERTPTVPHELVALIAYFRSAGQSARVRASHRTSVLSREIVERAATEYYDAGDFATADRIRCLRPPAVKWSARKLVLGFGAVTALLLLKPR